MTFALVLKLKQLFHKAFHVAIRKQFGKLRLLEESCCRRILKQNITGEAQNFL